MKEVVVGAEYMHYKQKKYRVLGVALHTETMEEVVVYEALYRNPAGQLWVRPKQMFLETVTVGDYTGPRFRLIESSLV